MINYIRCFGIFLMMYINNKLDLKRVLLLIMEMLQIKKINSVKEIESIQNSLQLLEDLGQGTFARVFKAKNLQTGQIIAVKQIQVPLLERQLALKEVQNLQRIQNDHIVTYYNSIYDMTDRSLNVIMELCKSSLRKQITQKIYTQEQLIDFLVQIVSAFLQLSDKKLMHLDLKPENILISQAHQGYYKVCDFGCSQIAIKSKLSRYDNHVFGTFNYLAPQNYLNYKGRFTSTSADVWSLGIIFYQMIYKTLPFKLDKDGLIQRKDIELYFRDQKKIEFPQTNNCSPSIINILKLMLTTEPKKRITWKELQKILIKEYGIDEYSFMNVRKIYFKHVTILRIFLTIIIICRKNVEFNPHPFWKSEAELLGQISQILLHLSFIYCLKFNKIYKYKIQAKLEPILRQKLQFAERNIEYEQKMISERNKTKMASINQLMLYEKDLINKLKQIKVKIQSFGQQLWQAMSDLELFCSETIRCQEVKGNLFASGDDTYYGNSIAALNITS